MKQKGTEKEKFIAQKLLLRLWSVAQNPPPVRRNIPWRLQRSMADTAVVYEKEAEKNLKEGNLEQCIVNCRRVLAADPRASTCNSLAWDLVWAPNPTEEHYKQAEKFARKAIEKGGRKPQYLDTLAASLAGRGKFKQALGLQLEALQKLNKSGTYAGRALLYLRRLAPK
jgi:tetratricopeptide (TPR) repeat protein